MQQQDNPLFHVSGCFAVFMLNLRGGRKTAIMYKWDVEKALALIEAERITGYKVPAYVSFQNEALVKNATGKILKKPIRQAYLDSL